MKFTTFVTLAATGAALAPLGAQVRVRTDRGPDEHRAALGLSTTATGTLRDTLGIMIAAVTPGSPAEKAGLEEGNRLAAINGVSLRANAADLEDSELSGGLTRRLTRELAKVKPGDEVELRVYRDGRTSAVRVRTADSDSLFTRRTVRLTRADMEDRPALGISLGSSGSRRDTLGVLVMGVGDSTPAERAGIEEGNRIAAINGINLRVAKEDADDRYLGSVKAQRLQREVSRLKPGSDVTLRVYANGRFRDVHMKVARSGDLPRDGRMMIFGGDGMRGMAPMAPRGRMMTPDAPLPPDGELRFELGPEFRRQMQELGREIQLLGPEVESIGPVLEQLRPELERVRTEVPRAILRARAEARRSVEM